MTHTPPVLPRSVKPRAPITVSVTPILVVTPTILYVERTDTYHPPNDLYAVLRAEPQSIVTCEGMARLLLDLHSHYSDDPRWQFCVTPLERQRWGPNREPTLLTTHDTLVSYFGWKGRPLPDGPRGGKRHEKNHYHISLDPVSFAGKGARQLTADAGADVDCLLSWAIGVRQFCVDNGLKIKPTTGGLAGQLLRDPRFYPKARRKVPAVINAKARDRLPGNHYRLYVKEGEQLEAYYLDQSSAHHRCALSLDFPCSNRLYSWGRYRKESTARGIPASVQARLLTYHGLFHLSVSVPHNLPFAPPWGETGGDHCVWVYSNELTLMREFGVHIHHVIEAHASPHIDTGLRTYAQWALDQLGPKTQPWVKPTLLATYGILAAKPRVHRVGYAQAGAGTTPQQYPAGAGFLPVMERKARHATEPAYANVIHRGMIEAETRLRSLSLARDLDRQGYTIVACYADSVFVATRDSNGINVALPLLPAGWKVESELTNLVFLNPVSFVSAEMSKTPGIPSRRMAMEQSSRIPQAHALRR